MSAVRQIKSRAKEMFADSDGSHNWQHSLRVVNLATHIADKEEANISVIKIAAYLHDIGRKYENKTG